MKQFIFTKIYRGIQLDVIVVCNSIAEAAKIADSTYYHISEYASKVDADPAHVLPYTNPGKLYTRFGRSGETGHFLPEYKMNIWMTWQEATSIIDTHRHTCKSGEKCGYR